MTDEFDDLDEQLDEAKIAERSVEICLRPDLIEEYKQLRGELAEGTEDSLAGGGSSDELAALEARIRKATKKFTLRALPRKEYRKLLTQHPPRKDRAEDRAVGYNLESFIGDLVRRCTVKPVMSETRWDKMEVKLSSGQWDKLHATAHVVNATEANLPF